MNAFGNVHPLVSVGVPVHNGSETLIRCIESLVNQTYNNIEIIISDNCSNDKTADIGKKYASEYRNVKYYRHAKKLTAVDNFRWVFSVSNGDYFMWAAHDDTRSFNYIEVLLNGMLKNGDCVLAYSDVTYFNESQEWRKSVSNFDHRSLFSRVKSIALGSCVPIYGLIKKNALESYRWYEPVHGPDRAILIYLICCGEFNFFKGAEFKYYSAQEKKSIKQRAYDNFFINSISFARFKESYYCGLAACDAIQSNSRVFHFLIVVYFFGLRIKKNHFNGLLKKLRQLASR